MNIIITGGHTGMGLELTKELLAEGHQIGLIVRSESRVNDAKKALENTANLQFFVADLGKRNEIQAVAEAIKNKWNIVDGIFNNAGVLLDKAYYSEQGNEMHFEINTLTPYYLVTSLKSLLDNSENAFVVNTATSGLNNQKSLNIKELKRPTKFVKLIGSYMHSKLALVLMMNYLAKQWSNIRFINVAPGSVKTKMTSGEGMPFLLKPIRNLFFSSPEKGAEKIYKAAFDEKFSDKSGIYVNGNIKPIQFELSESEFEEILSDNLN